MYKFQNSLDKSKNIKLESEAELVITNNLLG